MEESDTLGSLTSFVSFLVVVFSVMFGIFTNSLRVN